MIMRTYSIRVVLIFGIVAVILVVLGIVIGFSTALDGIVNHQIENNVRLENNTEQFDRWAALPFSLQFKIYAFNVSNPDEVLKGATPIVKEVGPFVYDQYRWKEDILYDKKTDTYTYTQRLRFEFNEEASALNQDTIITMLNVPLQGIFLQVEGTSRVTSINNFWSTMFEENGYFLNIPAKTIFFEGYHFCIDAYLNAILKFYCRQIKDMLGNSKTTTFDSEKIQFSFFAHKDNNNDGLYQISGGNNDINSLGEILLWEGKEYLDVWNGNESTCNHIHGRDSSIYPPFNNESSVFDIFNADICRIVHLIANGTSEYEDIEGIVLRMSINEMSNDGDKECYCIRQTLDLNGKPECLPIGFADMHSCIDAPTLTSYPHMLWADDAYSNTVNGLEPDPERHQSFVVIEPNTGTPLQGAKRIQFNMIIRPIDGIDVTQNLPHAVFPILWVEEELNLPEEQVKQLKNDYFAKVNMITVISYSLIGVGAGLTIICLGYFSFKLF